MAANQEEITVVRQVFSTKNYNLFKKLNSNREAAENPAHLKRLQKSFEKKALVSPIIVNGRYEVIDGGHRLLVLATLGLPVEFIIDDTLTEEDMQLYNANQKPWDVSDYVHFHSRNGVENVKTTYSVYQSFQDKYNFGDAATMALLTNKPGGYSASDRNALKDGVFTLGDVATSARDAERIVEIGGLCDKKKEFWLDKNFVSAMIMVFRNERYNQQHFMNRLETRIKRLELCRKITEFREEVEYIYNFRLPEAEKLVF